MKKRFLKTPIYDTLEDYLSKKPVRMHVPFHSSKPNNNVIPREVYNIDISEVSGYDIEGEDNPIVQSEKITADFFSCEHSFYLTGGASIGLLASMISLNKYGKKVILARNVHKSVINGVILSGLEPLWLEVDFINEWGVFSSINTKKLSELIQLNKDICGCVIVSPTYEGITSDIKEISDLCHKNGIPLIVDEAHGAHLCFLNDKGLKSAVQLGADIVVQSWHKSLGSLTQSGVLHLVNSKFFTYSDLKRSLDLVSSTSPSFLLLLSLELTRKSFVADEGVFFNQLLNNVLSLRALLEAKPEIKLLDSDDKLKIYLKMKNISGIELAFYLYKKYFIEIESANEIGLLMYPGKNYNRNTEDVISRTFDTLLKDEAFNHLNYKEKKFLKPEINKIVLSPRRAFMEGFNKNRASNYSSEIKASCPPGYVLNIPGSKKCN